MTALNPRELRNAFGSFMTGVAVVTGRDAAGLPVGFTANSFSSVSLDPPLLLVCPGRFLSSFDAMVSCTHFAVSVLAEGQEEVSNTFASYKGDRFAQVDHRLDLHQIPVIAGAVAQFSCETRQVVEAGDHAILVGEVRDFTHSERLGLGYVGGQYFSLGLERAALESVTGSVVCGAIIEQGHHVLLEKTPEGFCPPRITAKDRGNLRNELGEALSNRGIPVELGPAYSAFDDVRARTHHAYFLASATDCIPNGSLQAVPVRDLASLSYTSPAITKMMARFAIESQTRSFALYLGDSERGDVQTLVSRT